MMTEFFFDNCQEFKNSFYGQINIYIYILDKGEESVNSKIYPDTGD